LQSSERHSSWLEDFSLLEDCWYAYHGLGHSRARGRRQANDPESQCRADRLLPQHGNASSARQLWNLTQSFVQSVNARKFSSHDEGTRSIQTENSRTDQLRRIYLSVFFASLGLSYVFLIPAFAEGLGASYLELGLIGTVRSVPYMFLPVIVGYIGDRFDRSRLYLSSIFATGVGMLVLAAMRTVEGIILVQVFLGIGFSLFWPLSEALVSETAPLHRRTSIMGTYGVAWATGFLIGPLFGGLIADGVGFQAAFLVAGTIVLITAAVAVAAIHGSRKRDQSRADKHSTRPEWALVSRLLPMLVVQIPYGIVFAFIVSIFPGYAVQSGLTTFEVGVLVSGFTFARIVMFTLSGRFERFGERKSATFAFMAMALVLLLIPIDRSFVALLADMCVLGLCVGIIYPQTVGYISKHSPSANLGFAVGLYETIFGIGFAIGPLASGLIAEATTLNFVYGFLAGIALSAIGLLAFSKASHIK